MVVCATGRTGGAEQHEHRDPQARNQRHTVPLHVSWLAEHDRPRARAAPAAPRPGVGRPATAAPAAVNNSSTRDCRMRARFWAMSVARRMSGTSSGLTASAFSSSWSNSSRFCAGWRHAGRHRHVGRGRPALRQLDRPLEVLARPGGVAAHRRRHAVEGDEHLVNRAVGVVLVDRQRLLHQRAHDREVGDQVGLIDPDGDRRSPRRAQPVELVDVVLHRAERGGGIGRRAPRAGPAASARRVACSSRVRAGRDAGPAPSAARSPRSWSTRVPRRRAARRRWRKR